MQTYSTKEDLLIRLYSNEVFTSLNPKVVVRVLDALICKFTRLKDIVLVTKVHEKPLSRLMDTLSFLGLVIETDKEFHPTDEVQQIFEQGDWGVFKEALISRKYDI